MTHLHLLVHGPVKCRHPAELFCPVHVPLKRHAKKIWIRASRDKYFVTISVTVSQRNTWMVCDVTAVEKEFYI